MVWTELIKEQAFEAAVMFAGGIALGILYSLFLFVKMNVLRSAEKARNVAEQSSGDIKKSKFVYAGRAIAMLEILFWIFAAFFVCGFLRYSSNGEINFHNFLALTFGVLLWHRMFYGNIKC